MSATTTTQTDRFDDDVNDDFRDKRSPGRTFHKPKFGSTYSWSRGLIIGMLGICLASLTGYVCYQGITPDSVGVMVSVGLIGIGVVLFIAIRLTKSDKSNKKTLGTCLAFLDGIAATVLSTSLIPDVGVGSTAALFGVLVLLVLQAVVGGYCRHDPWER